jgi:hypothetical protein
MKNPMPQSKKLLVSKVGTIRRRFTLTSPTVDYIAYLLKVMELNNKERSILISRCIESYYLLFSSDLVTFQEEASVNVCIRGAKADEAWCQLTMDVDDKLMKMVDFIQNQKNGFSSPSSLVNHAIANYFSRQPKALSNYLKSQGIGLPSRK